MQQKIEIKNNIVAYDILVRLVDFSKRLMMTDDGPRVVNEIAAKSGYIDKYTTVNSVQLATCEGSAHYQLVVSVTGKNEVEGNMVTGNVYIQWRGMSEGFVLDY